MLGNPESGRYEAASDLLRDTPSIKEAIERGDALGALNEDEREEVRTAFSYMPADVDAEIRRAAIDACERRRRVEIRWRAGDFGAETREEGDRVVIIVLTPYGGAPQS